MSKIKGIQVIGEGYYTNYLNPSYPSNHHNKDFDFRDETVILPNGIYYPVYTIYVQDKLVYKFVNCALIIDYDELLEVT